MEGAVEVGGVPGLVILSDGAEEYKVEKIVSKRLIKGEERYRIKWVGWDKKYNTWEPISNLQNCLDLVQRYENRFKRPNPVPQKVDKVEESDSNDLNTQDQAVRKRKREEPEPEEEDQCDDDDDDEMLDKVFMGPLFRRYWKSTEIPLRVLSSTKFEGELFHLIKIRKVGEEEEIPEPGADPMDGLSSDNLVIVLADYFNCHFPDMVAEYYESKLQLVDEVTPEEETAENVEMTATVHNQTSQGVTAVNSADLTSLMEVDDALCNVDDSNKFNVFRGRLNDLDPFGLPLNLDAKDPEEENSESDEDDSESHYFDELPFPP